MACRAPRGTELRPQSTVMCAERPFRIRTVTAGTHVASPRDVAPIARAVERAAKVRDAFEAAGYEVQNTRVAMPPLLAALGRDARWTSIEAVRALDTIATNGGALLSVGPVLTEDRVEPDMGRWVADLLGSTRNVMCSVAVASARGIHAHAARAAADVMAALAHATPDGRDNFRFAAAANIAPGTPFFPVSYHDGPDSLAIGVEAAPIVARVFAERPPLESAAGRLRDALDAALLEVEQLARACATDHGVAYGGIDPSPAPLGNRSIAGAIESLTGRPFGSASTLRACAIVTEALRSLRVQTCGYAGLMLPVLEDEVLAARAGEGRYGLRDLLLYSSVCGTGLDVVPVPGAASTDALAAVIGDVAALSVRLGKPLSARLCLVPGKAAGERATFDNPYLTDCVVFPLD